METVSAEFRGPVASAVWTSDVAAIGFEESAPPIVLARVPDGLVAVADGQRSGVLRSDLPTKPLVTRLPDGRVAIAGRHPRRWRTEVWVFEVDGALRKRWVVEGHATCLQADAAGDLWLAFVHDADVPEPEHPHDPAVQPAVARWSADGTLLGMASVAPHAGSNALNVASDGVWSCADGGAFFRLPVAGGIDRWDAGVHHVQAIAASADAALLVWDLRPLRALLVQLRPGGVIGIGHVIVVDHDGIEIDAERVDGRGLGLHIASAGRWLVLDLNDLL